MVRDHMIYCIQTYTKLIMEKVTRYEFVDKINEDFICKRCETVARLPNITSCCGESLCQSCVDHIKESKAGCPCCKQEEFSTLVHQKYKAKISALKVYCLMRSHGCEWIGELGQIEGHLDVANGDCMYVIIDCPQKCESQIQKLCLEKHLQEECPNRAYTCPHCSLQDTHQMVLKHYEVCQYYPVVCANRCGATFERGELEDHRKLCSLEQIECQFSFAGCEAVFKREKTKEHSSEEYQTHLSLVAETLKATKKTLSEQQEKHALEVKETLDRYKTECEQKMAEREKELQQRYEDQLKQRDEKIKLCESKMEEILKKLNKPKKHSGTFHCCTWCATGGKKDVACGCGSKMAGGYSGCGHGHPGHPGSKHWSCCGSTDQHSDCLA